MERSKGWFDEFIIKKLLSLFDILTHNPGYFFILTLLAMFQYKAYFLDRVTKHHSSNLFLFIIFLICTVVLVVHTINHYFMRKEESQKYKTVKGVALFILIFFNLIVYLTSFVIMAEKYIIPFLNHYTGNQSISQFVLTLLIIIAGYLIIYFRKLFKTKQEAGRIGSQQESVKQ